MGRVLGLFAEDHSHVLVEVPLLVLHLVKRFIHVRVLDVQFLTRRELLFGVAGLSVLLLVILDLDLDLYTLLLLVPRLVVSAFLLVEVPLLLLVGVRDDHLHIVADLHVSALLGPLQVIRVAALEQAHLDLGRQVELFHLVGVELDRLLLKDGLGHAHPEVLPAGLHLGILDRRVRDPPLDDQLVDHLLAIEGHVPLGVALIAIPA